MSITVIVLVTLVVLFALLLMELPVGISLGGSGALGLILLRGAEVAGSTLGSIPYTSVASYSLVVIPMFLLMGVVATEAGLAKSLFRSAARHLRGVPGGLGVATVAACAGFAAVSGSSIATVASIGRMSIDEMRALGYDLKFAAGIVGAAGTLGVLIPPSIILVIYGILSGESVSAMLVAGIVPGILSAIIYVALVVVRAWRTPALVGAGGGRVPADQASREPSAASLAGSSAVLLESEPRPGEATRTRERAVDEPTSKLASEAGRGGLLRILILFAVVIGGVYSGQFTVIESSALGALTAVLMLLQYHWREPRHFVRVLTSCVRSATSTTSSVMLIVVGASIFSYFILLAGIPNSFSRWVLGLGLSASMVVLLMLLMTIPLGMLLEPISILLIVTPLMTPVLSSLGLSGIWFGILLVKMIELAMITPPVGLNVFVLAGTVKELSVVDAFKSITPYVAADVLTIALIFLFPALVTWLPSLQAG